MSTPAPNTETRTAMQDTLNSGNLSGPFLTIEELFAALNTEDSNK